MSGPIEIDLPTLRSMPLPEPHGGSKDARGRVMVIGGSVAVPGAALLAGVAALRVGAGKLHIATCARNATLLGLLVPESRVSALAETPDGGIDPRAAEALADEARSCDAVLLGPGMMDPEAVAAFVRAFLPRVSGASVVIDADAIKPLRKHPELPAGLDGRAIVTPHAGEMAGLLGVERNAVEADPLAAALRAASRLQSVVVMKGAVTHIVTPQGQAWTSRAGNVGLATSGSGDTLAGFIAGLLARGATPVTACCWGVYLHGSAGDVLARKRGPLGYLARELPDEVPALMAALAG